MARIRRYLGRVELWLDRREKAALARAVDDLGGEAEPAAAASPPATWLRGRAYDDPALEDEYRRLTAPDVVSVVRADIDAIREDLGGKTEPLRLDDDRALSWLRALNHLRLTAAVRLGIEEDGWDDSAGGTPDGDENMAMLLDLGWVQEGILAALEA